MKKLIILIFLLVFTQSFAQSKMTLTVLDATVKDKAVGGVGVIFQKAGESSVKASTDASGKIIIDKPFKVDDETVSMITVKDGYSSMTVKCPCDGFTYAISPKMTDLDGVRIVLSWGDSPEDLDSHLVYGDNHIYWDHKVASQANLDVDDTDSYGPETITINKKQNGIKYLYAVHNFTDESNLASRGLSNSSAKVFVYIGSTLIKSYYVSPNKTGNLWVVFAIDENSNIIDINEFSGSRGLDFVKNDLNKFLNRSSVFNAGEVAEKRSKEINALGEKAYHNKSYDDAIGYYREAIDLNPNNGQAYSNLGLAFQKMGNIAEAIWANRKAIDLANGANKNTVRASSYYNIAKIYESQGKYEEALQNYRLALESKDHSAYKDGIKRVQGLLK